MTKAIQQQQAATDSLEQVLLNGDLGALSSADRIRYYQKTCESLGLNPLTKPFEYIKLNGKLTLYARKDATDQLRQIHGVSIAKPDIQQIDNLIIVTVEAIDKTGRTDSDIGVVGKGDMGGNIGNALMKAVTKAKRRVTLSICGLGMLDETEVETIPDARPFTEPEPAQIVETFESERKIIAELCKDLNTAGDGIKWTGKTLKEFVNEYFEVTNGLDDLDNGQFIELTEELSIRLEHLGETATETETTEAAA